MGFQLTCSCAQGSELECELLEEDNLSTFVAAWIQKAASAQGSCATIGAQWLGFLWCAFLYLYYKWVCSLYIYIIYLNDKNMMPKTIILFLTHTVVLCPNFPSRLEGFGSQDHLASLIKEAGAALGQHRKELINLDPSQYTMEVVGAILAKAT